jgi:hypothetical protein
VTVCACGLVCCDAFVMLATAGLVLDGDVSLFIIVTSEVVTCFDVDTLHLCYNLQQTDCSM